MSTPQLTIVGLGPGDASLLTLEAQRELASASEIWLRTARHPAVAGLPEGPRRESFDRIYDELDTFDAVYERIASDVLGLARRPSGVVYAVPGHPLFGEATVRALLDRAAGAGIERIRIVAGLSFLDAAAAVLRVDPLADGVLLLDALSLGDHGRALVPQRPTFIAQVYDPRIASSVKLSLLEAYPPAHRIHIVRGGGTAAAHIVDTIIARLDHDAGVFDHLATLYVPPLAAAGDLRTFEGLRRIVAQLRSPDGGCPWDLEQTHETLRRFLLEEAYEALDALDEGDPHRLAEELGDLMMQVLLHAQIAEDDDEFVVEDVISSIARKLVRRHPHVFGDVQVAGAGDVVRNWEALKKEERGDEPLLHAVPLALPALAQAQALQSRAAKAGLTEDARVSPDEASTRLRLPDRFNADELGELLFAIVSLAEQRDVDAEEALRLANRRFRAAIGEQEQSAATPG